MLSSIYSTAAELGLVVHSNVISLIYCTTLAYIHTPPLGRQTAVQLNVWKKSGYMHSFST